MDELVLAVRLGVVLVVFALGLLLYASFRWRQNIRNFIAARKDHVEPEKDSGPDRIAP